ncbi:MAG: cation-transporting P-type ATPase, partial [Candidatus Limnocylindrales bacterium]
MASRATPKRRPAAPKAAAKGAAATPAGPAVPAPAAPAAPGLTSAEAARQLRTDGPNAVGREGHRGRLAILISQFASPLVLILLAASLVSVAVGDKVEAGIILTIVLLSAALGFVQEARSAAAVEALQARLALKATVIRDGKQQDLAIVGLVVGDLIVLGAGDIVP